MSEPSEYYFETPDNAAGLRADKVLAAHYPQYSRSQIQRLFSAGLVWRDNQALIKKQKLSAGDGITFTAPSPQPLTLKPAPIPVEILYEDENLIVANKPAGMVVHPGHGTGEDTLVHALLHHCAGKLSKAGGIERPGIVHRLDKDTTGAIVVAKSDAAFFALSAMFAERKMTKQYRALVQGAPRLDSGSIQTPIGRHPVLRIKMAVVPHGRPARSDWKKINEFNASVSLLEIDIYTGRTHQIRTHLSSEGHPIVGDSLYGYKKIKTLAGKDTRVFLHARRLAFTHPVTQEPMDFTAPVPDDFQRLVDFLSEPDLIHNT